MKPRAFISRQHAEGRHYAAGFLYTRISTDIHAFAAMLAGGEGGRLLARHRYSAKRHCKTLLRKILTARFHDASFPRMLLALFTPLYMRSARVANAADTRLYLRQFLEERLPRSGIFFSMPAQ